jgi:hypothetical protein
MTRLLGMRSPGAALLCLLLPVCARATGVQISEVLYDALGADDGHVFVELHGAAGHDLDLFLLEGINGADGRAGPVLALSGRIPADGFFVIADQAGETTLVPEADLVLNFDLQNGPDSLVLRGPDGGVVDALGYGLFGPEDVFAGEGSPAPDPPAGSSVARRFADVDTDDNGRDFHALADPTPGWGPTQVPEPASVALALAGIGSALLLRLRSPTARRPRDRFLPPRAGCAPARRGRSG